MTACANRHLRVFCHFFTLDCESDWLRLARALLFVFMEMNTQTRNPLFNRLFLLLAFWAWLGLFWPPALQGASPSPQKIGILEHLSTQIQSNKQRLKDIEALLSDSSRRDFLLREKTEYELRQEFLDRLVLRVAAHYQDQDLRQFFVSQLNDIASVELSRSASDSRIWRFCTYLAAILQSSSEREEGTLHLIQAYVQESSLTSPLPPQIFLARRHYTNGITSESAHGLSQENLGWVTELDFLGEVF